MSNCTIQELLPSVEFANLMAERNRAWYYRNAVIAFRRMLVKYSYGKGDQKPYLDAVLAAAERDTAFAVEMIEQDGDRFRFCNHKHNRSGKVISCDVMMTERNS